MKKKRFRTATQMICLTCFLLSYGEQTSTGHAQSYPWAEKREVVESPVQAGDVALMGSVGKLILKGVNIGKLATKVSPLKFIPKHSELKKAAEAGNGAYLRSYTLEKHILPRHGYDVVAGAKTKFVPHINIRGMIHYTTKHPQALIKPNTDGRNGYIFEHTFKRMIGTNSQGV